MLAGLHCNALYVLLYDGVVNIFAVAVAEAAAAVVDCLWNGSITTVKNAVILVGFLPVKIYVHRLFFLEVEMAAVVVPVALTTPCPCQTAFHEKMLS